MDMGVCALASCPALGSLTSPLSVCLRYSPRQLMVRPRWRLWSVRERGRWPETTRTSDDSNWSVSLFLPPSLPPSLSLSLSSSVSLHSDASLSPVVCRSVASLSLSLSLSLCVGWFLSSNLTKPLLLVAYLNELSKSVGGEHLKWIVCGVGGDPTGPEGCAPDRGELRH